MAAACLVKGDCDYSFVWMGRRMWLTLNPQESKNSKTTLLPLPHKKALGSMLPKICILLILEIKLIPYEVPTKQSNNHERGHLVHSQVFNNKPLKCKLMLVTGKCKLCFFYEDKWRKNIGLIDWDVLSIVVLGCLTEDAWIMFLMAPLSMGIVTFSDCKIHPRRETLMFVL